jgi:mannosyl-oligosaccharide glucosidase
VYTLPDRSDAGARAPTLAVWQVTCTLPCTVDLAYHADHVAAPDGAGWLSAAALASGEGLTALLDARRAAYDVRFEQTFSLSVRGYNEDDRAAARAALANLIGGIAFFHGTSLCVRPRTHAHPRGSLTSMGRCA